MPQKFSVKKKAGVNNVFVYARFCLLNADRLKESEETKKNKAFYVLKKNSLLSLISSLSFNFLIV